MIKLEDFYKTLALVPLSNTGILTDDGLDIEENRKQGILALINDGLTRLHSRFPLKINFVFVEMQEGRTEYPLLKRWSYKGYVNKKGLPPFIMDSTTYPFAEDVIKILNVYDSVGCRRKLNDDHDCHGLFTPRPDTLQCMRPKHCEVLNVQYQAKHPTLIYGVAGQEIDLPETLNTALENWVAYRYYTGLNTAENTAKAAECLQMYESLCGEVKDFDLANGSMSNTNILFERRGWR